MSKKTIKLIISLMLSVILMMSITLSASAYSFLTGGKHVSRPVVMYAHTSVNANYINAFQNAIVAWNNAGKGTLVTYGGIKTVPFPTIPDGYNGITTGARGNTVAIAITSIYYNTSTNIIQEANIDVNTTHPYSFSSPQIGYDAQSVFTHEIGHVLGLGESNATEATMYKNIAQNEIKKRSLDSDDIAGITALGY